MHKLSSLNFFSLDYGLLLFHFGEEKKFWKIFGGIILINLLDNMLSRSQFN